jgi:hypothetical protein
MKNYKVTFTDTIKANTEDDAYGELLDYLSECVRFGDVTAFDFAAERPDPTTELLSALRNLLKDHKRMFPEAHPNSTIKWSECEEVKQAKRAIAKAEGRTE